MTPTVTKNTKGFKLVHRQTGLTLGEYKDRHSLRYYLSDGKIFEDTDFQNVPIQAILREDGAIGLQRLKPTWGSGELYFLPRDDWEIHWKDSPAEDNNPAPKREKTRVVVTYLSDSLEAKDEGLSKLSQSFGGEMIGSTVQRYPRPPKRELEFQFDDEAKANQFRRSVQRDNTTAHLKLIP